MNIKLNRNLTTIFIKKQFEKNLKIYVKSFSTNSTTDNLGVILVNLNKTSLPN